MALFKFTTLLPLEFPTCPRAQKSESGQELLTLEFLGPSDLVVYFKKMHWCHTERKKVLDVYFFMYFYGIIIQLYRQCAVSILSKK